MTSQLGPAYKTMANVDFVVPAGEDWHWSSDDVTQLAFPARTQLIAEGSLAMDGVTLTEAVAGEGWFGVLYEPDGGGYLRGVTIEKFGYTNGGGGGGGGSMFAPLVCGLTVNDRWLAVYRSFIQGGFNGAYGVCSFGGQAQISLRDENGTPTTIQDNEGHGLFAYSQGRIFLRGSDVLTNGGNGGLALGTGARIYANENSLISGNGGVGLVARSDGNIYLYNPNTPSATTETTLDANEGGALEARNQGSYINAGTFSHGHSAQGTCQAACQNFVLNHHLDGIPFEVKSASGTLVFAEFNNWGLNRDSTDLNLDDDGGKGMILINPIWDGSSLREGPVAVKSAAEPSGFRETTRGFITKAMEKAAQGEWISALAHIQTAVAMASSEDELRLAMGAVSAMLGQPGAPEMPAGLLQAIEAHMGHGQSARPMALRALMSAHRMHGHDTDARTMAQALIAEYASSEHALEGLAQEVELALAADDLSGAQVALATMEADFPDDPLTEAARAYFVLVAGEDALPARTAASAIVATAGQSSASIGTEVSGFTLHAAYPNPFNPQAVVPFSVTEAARVRIVVFDMLGREVATLADSRYEVGIYQAVFDGSALPSGMYLVRANVTPENGNAASAFTQRITLLK